MTEVGIKVKSISKVRDLQSVKPNADQKQNTIWRKVFPSTAEGKWNTFFKIKRFYLPTPTNGILQEPKSEKVVPSTIFLLK